MIIQARFGTVQGALGYQFYDASGALLGSRATAGISALPETGSYIVTATAPPTAAGVYWNDTATFAERTEDLRDALAAEAILAILDVADSVLLAEEYVPSALPVLVIPQPDPDELLSVVYVYTESITNVKREGIVISFQLMSTPAKSERVLEIAPKNAPPTDENGFTSITLQRNLRYRVVCAALGLDKQFTPTTGTYNLLSII